MKQGWLRQNGCRDCILFFNGWGMDNNALLDISSKNYDIYTCYGYGEENQLTEDFGKYQNIHLVAWSLGVFIANKIIADTQLSFSKRIAINGTLQPRNDDKGIPKNIFDTTLANWNSRNRDKFMMRSLGGKKIFDNHKHLMPDRSIEDQKEALLNIGLMIDQNHMENTLKWDSVICGNKDMIFTIDNQLSSWGEYAVSISELPHFPFIYFNTWESIINH